LRLRETNRFYLTVQTIILYNTYMFAMVYVDHSVVQFDYYNLFLC